MSGRLLVLLVVAFFAGSTTAQDFQTAPLPRTETAKSGRLRFVPMMDFGLRDGTPIYLKTDRALDSSSAKSGDKLLLRVQQEVRMNGVLVIPEGAIASATVTKAQPRQRLRRDGKLDIRIESVELVDGGRVPLRAVKSVRGKSAGENATLMYASVIDWTDGIVFWSVLPFVRGSEVEVPIGMPLVAYIDGDQPLIFANFDRPTLIISSQPVSAEVEIDGLGAGVTPLTRALPKGDHSIKITTPGHAPWTRTITLVGGVVNLSAELPEITPN